jgi:hypothetical protein
VDLVVGCRLSGRSIVNCSLGAGPVSQNSGRVRNGSAFLFQNDVVHPFCLPRWPKKPLLFLSPSHIGTFL